MNARLIALLAVAAEVEDDPPAPVVVARGECGSTALIVAGVSTGNTTGCVKSSAWTRIALRFISDSTGNNLSVDIYWADHRQDEYKL